MENNDLFQNSPPRPNSQAGGQPLFNSPPPGSQPTGGSAAAAGNGSMGAPMGVPPQSAGPGGPGVPGHTPGPMGSGPQPPMPPQPTGPGGAPPMGVPTMPQGEDALEPKKANGGRGPWLIVSIIFIILSLILGAGFGWAFVQYIDYRDNVDFKISEEVAFTTKQVSQEMEEKFQEERKSPYSLFVGPDDYGRVSFEYPNTWSVYIQNETSVGTSSPFEAYFYPYVVPPVSKEQQFALRMLIEDMDYDKAVNRYAKLVKDGSLKSSPVQVGLLNGTRLDGNFTKDIRGAAVIFKVRDKSLTLRTDSNSFMADFDKLIQTIQVTE